MKIVIVEDEENNVLFIKKLLSNLLFPVEVVGIADEVEEAVELINREKPDLLLLDVLIKGGTSFNVLEKIEPYSFESIFITAYNHFAIEAIKKQALDYILKPIVADEFASALNRSKEKIEEKQKLKDIIGTSTHQYFSLKTHIGSEMILLQSILYFEADGSYTRCVTEKNTVVISKNIGDIEKEITSSHFFRCHHSYIVNQKAIDKVELHRSGFITCSNGQQIPVSQRKKKEFLEFLKHS